jgi:hypothetical protein
MDLTNEAQRADFERARRKSEERLRFITPGRPDGASPLGLAPLLEQRRLDFGIPDPCFDSQPVFDCCTLYQVPKFSDRIGSLHVPDEVKIANVESAPRAILLAAGPAALDYLKSNGVDVGHIVTFVKLAPYRTLACWISGEAVWTLQVQASSIRGSEDLRERMRMREVSVRERTDKDGFVQHYFSDADGKVWHPQKPWGNPDNE